MMSKFFKLSSDKGFTLLEMIMVIVIISLLAAIAVPYYIKVAKKGHASEGISNVSDLKGAEIRYYAEYGTIDTSLNNLDIENPNTLGGQEFSYTVTGSDPKNMVITATGTGGAEGITVTYDGSTGELCTTYPDGKEVCK